MWKADLLLTAMAATTTTRRTARCTKHAFAPRVRSRPRGGTAGHVTFPGHGHIRAHPRCGLASASSVAGNDPVNNSDPSGLCLNSKGINVGGACSAAQLAAMHQQLLQTQAQSAAADAAAAACTNPLTCVINDPGAVVASFNANRGQIATNVGIVLGVAAAATGVGGIIEVAAGSAAIGAGLGLASAGAGFAAAALDNGACTHGDTAACLGRDFGLLGAGLGLLATGAAGVAALGWISLEGTTAAVLGGLGATGLNLGMAGTAIDIYGAVSRDGCR